MLPEAKTPAQLNLDSMEWIPDKQVRHHGVSEYFDDYDMNNVRVHINHDFTSSIGRRLKSGKSSKALVQLADVHFSNGKFPKAREYYLKALNSNPDSAEILKKIIASSIRSGKLDDADKFFKRLLDASGESSKIAIDYITFRIQSFTKDDKEIAETKKIATKYLYLYDNNDNINNSAGLFYLLVERDFNKALTCFKKSLAINPSNIHATNNTGVVYEMKGSYAKAESYFRQAIAKNSDYSVGYENIASVNLKMNKPLEAIKILNIAFKNRVGITIDWLENLGKLRIENDSKNALDESINELYEIVLSAPDPKAGFYNNAAVAALKTGYKKKGLGYFQQALDIIKSDHKQYKRIDSNASVILFNIARVRFDQANIAESKKVLELLLNYFPNDVKALNLLSRIQIGQKDFDSARENLLKSNSQVQYNKEAVVNLSYIYDVIDFKYDLTIELLKDYTKLKPGSFLDILILNNYSYALLKTDKVKEAKAIIKNLPDAPELLATKGLLHIKQNELKLADEHFTKYFDFLSNSGDVFNLNIAKMFYNLELATFHFAKGDLGLSQKYAKLGLEFNSSKKARVLLNEILSSTKKA